MYTAYTYSDMRENNIRTYISVHLYDSLSRAEQGGTLLFLYKRNVCRNNKANTCVYMVRRLAFPAPPPPMVWSGRVGGGGENLGGAWGWRMRRVVWPVEWGAAVDGHGSLGHREGRDLYASPAQAMNPVTWGMFLFLLTLTCT